MGMLVKNYSIVEFIESLGEPQKEIITNYLSTEEQKSSSGARLDQVNCECGSGQSSCSAEGTFSACCICWDSSSETGACGVYFGVASCRNEAKEPKILGKATLKSQWITFQLKKFKESLAFLRTKGIDTHSIQFSLNELTKQAVFD